MKKTAESMSKKSKGPKLSRGQAKPKRFVIGLAGFEKVSAIEGLHLTRGMKRTFRMLERQGASAPERRAAIIKRYG
jgi:hypothetical protein